MLKLNVVAVVASIDVNSSSNSSIGFGDLSSIVVPTSSSSVVCAVLTTIIVVMYVNSGTRSSSKFNDTSIVSRKRSSGTNFFFRFVGTSIGQFFFLFSHFGTSFFGRFNRRFNNSIGSRSSICQK